MDQPLLRQALSSKEREFIDHSLLAPTYIRDSNNYILDFMESTPLVFPNKTVVHVPASNGNTQATAGTTTPTTAAGYNVKVPDSDSLTPDLHFPSSIFHYRPTQSEVEVNNVANVAEAALNASNPPTQQSAPLPLVIGGGTASSTSNNSAATFNHNKQTQYIALNGSFLGASGSKSFCDDNAAVNQAGEDATVQQFLLADANVSLNDPTDLINTTGDVLYSRQVSNARKVLPHKKRISRKLRVSLCVADNVLPPPLRRVHKLQEEEPLNVSVYSCEICGNTSASQLQFFAHLKQHYEPTTPDTILAAMKTSLEDLQPHKLCSIDKKSSSNNVDQAFNDVHLNFPDFSGVDETPMRHVMDAGEDGNEMKMLSATDLSKCMSYVAQAPTPPLKRTVEVEFSDSEDMLEGIRNVVDKVSIEDTCDALDLMTSNGMRGSWFTNDNFSSISFKNKPYNDVTFTEPLPPMPMMASKSLATDTPPKEPSPLPPAEKLLSYKKSDGSREKIDLSLPPDDVDADVDEDEDETNRATFYNDPLPSMRLSSVDTDDQDLRCHSPQEPTTPTDILEPLHVTPFELPENTATQLTIENGNLTAVDAIQQAEESNDGNGLVENEVFCKEELQAQDYENNGLCFDESDRGIESYTPSPIHGSAEGDQKKYPCTKCRRSFNSHNALKYHNLTHTGLRPHQCDMCGKSFYALSALKTHTRTHTGDKPFKCDVCQRDFRQWSDLRYHFVSKHTEDKNHQCEFCGKAFSRKYSLVLHRRIHTRERNFICEYCQKTFRASTYLQNHRKIHTGEKPCECTICSKRFRMIGDLRRHERIHQRREAKKSAKIADSAKSAID